MHSFFIYVKSVKMALIRGFLLTYIHQVLIMELYYYSNMPVLYAEIGVEHLYYLCYKTIYKRELEGEIMRKSNSLKKVLALALTVMMVFGTLPSVGLADTGTEISSIPEVQSVEYGSGVFTLTGESRFYIVSDIDPAGTEIGGYVQLINSQFAAKGIPSSSVLPVVYGAEANAQAGDIVVKLASGKAQGYTISIADRITVTGNDAIGAYYGLTTLLQSFVSGGTTLKYATVTDYPDVQERSVYIDCGRVYYSPDVLKAIIRTMSYNKMNVLYLDFSNNNALRFFLNDMNITVNGTGYNISNVKPSDGWLSESDMDGIIEEANKYGVEIIPTFNSPGHIGALYSLNNSFFDKASATDYDASIGKITLDITNASAYEFGEKVVALYVDYFAEKGCTNFNIAADEATLGNVKYNSNSDVFVQYVNDLNSYIKSKGMKTRMFNDGIVSTGSGIDTDIGVLYWAPQDVNASALIADGHEVVNFSYGAGLYNVYVGSRGSWWVWNQNAKQLYDSWNPGVLCRDTSSESTYTPTEQISDYKTQEKFLGANFAIWSDYAFVDGRDGEYLIANNNKNLIEKIHIVAERSWSTKCTDSYDVWSGSMAAAPGVASNYAGITALPTSASIEKAEEPEVSVTIKIESEGTVNAVKVAENVYSVAAPTAGDTVQLGVEIANADVSTQTAWASGNKQVADVDETGLVTFTGETGTVTIDCTVTEATKARAAGDVLAEATVTFNVTNELPSEYTGEVTSEEVQGSSEWVLVTNGTSGIESGKRYLIVSANSGTAYTLTSSGGASSVTIANSKIATAADNIIWTFIANGSGWSIQDSNGTYMYPNATRFMGWNYSLSKGQSSPQAVTASGSSSVTLSRTVNSDWFGGSTTSYIRYSSNQYSAGKNSSNLYLFKESVTSQTTRYNASLSGINALKTAIANAALVEDEYTEESWAAFEAAQAAANTAIANTANPYNTEADATTQQEAVNAAALDLYNAWQGLEKSVRATITVTCYFGDTVIGTYTYYTDQSEGYQYTITPPAIDGYVYSGVKEGALTGTTEANGKVAVSLNYAQAAFSIPNSISMPVTFIDYRADGLLFDFQTCGDTYTYGLVHGSGTSDDNNAQSANGGTLNGEQYGTKIAGTTLENTGYTGEYYSGRWYAWGNKWSRSGMVLAQLGENGQPVYTQATIKFVAGELAAGKYNNSEMGSVANDNDIIYNTFIAAGAARSIVGTSTTGFSTAFAADKSWDNITNAYDLAYYLLNNLYVEDANTAVSNGQTVPIYGMGVDAYDSLILKQATDADGNTYYYLDSDYAINYDRENRAIYNESTSSGDQFYPLEGLGYDAVYGDTTDKTSGRNGNFAMTSSAQFEYNSSENLFFEFSGDDDVYLFINGQLVLDLGGAHGVCTKRVDLNDVAEQCGLVEGEIATFTFFYMERCSDASNFSIRTNIELVSTNMVVEKKAVQIDESEYWSTEISTGSLVPAETRVKYDLIVRNTGTEPITSIRFTDADNAGNTVKFGYDASSAAIANTLSGATVGLGGIMVFVSDNNDTGMIGDPQYFSTLDEVTEYLRAFALPAGQSLHVFCIVNELSPAANTLVEYRNTLTVNAVSGGTSLSGNSTHEIKSFDIENTTLSYVVDYGLPVTFENLFATGEKNYVSTVTLPVSKTKFGSATLNGSGSSATVTYTMASMISASDQITLNVGYTASGNQFTANKVINIIPATTVYYEDSYVEFSEDDWTQVGTTINGYQSDDLVGDAAANVYGYDQAYGSCSTYSMGSAMKATVSASDYTQVIAGTKSWPYAKFDFYGIGFDVISLTSNRTGAVMVEVKNANGEIVRDIAVDTFYGYKQDENGNWVVDADSTDALYQIPVINVEGLEYGRYTVTIMPAYNEFFDNANAGSYDFYLDAIRVYDPAGAVSGKAGSEQGLIGGAYISDKEENPDYKELRNLLLNQQDIDADSEVEGAVFIDGKDSVTNPDISDYRSKGPNNEVYLANGQAVAFYLVTDKSGVEAQIGAKLVSGTSATLEGVGEGISLSTATDMYYELQLTWTLQDDGSYKSNLIVLTNANTSGNAVISLTNIKLTSGTAAVRMMMSRASAQTAVMAVRKLMTPVFTPDTFEVTANGASVSVGANAVITVTTSADVDSITVNGKEITKFKNDRRTGLKTWTYTEKANEVGELSFEVIAYDSEGTASEAVEQTVTVVKKSLARTILDRMISLFA